jgi:hypothetical protein
MNVNPQVTAGRADARRNIMSLAFFASWAQVGRYCVTQSKAQESMSLQAF